MLLQIQECQSPLTEARALATMVCRKCKRAVLFGTQIEPDYTEEEQEELDEFTDQLYSQLGITGVDLTRGLLYDSS